MITIRQYQQHFAKRVEMMVLAEEKKLSQNRISDMEQYRSTTGYIKGLQHAATLSKELMHSIEDQDFEDGGQQ